MSIQHAARTAFSAAVIALVAAPAFSHGGQYRGPGDTVPPGTKPHRGKAGGNGPTTPGPGGPSAPTRGGPGVPTKGTGPGPSGLGRGFTGTGGGGNVDPGLARWQFWWEFNKDPFLQLKDAVHSGTVHTGSDDYIMGRFHRPESIDRLVPSESDIARMRGALRRTLLDATSSRDVLSACMVGLAKIGRDPAILPVFKRFLRRSNQEIRETAALALGIAALEEAVPDLEALATDTSRGRDLVGRAEVGFRTRSFACYGLGLIAWARKDTAVKRRVLEAMRGLIDDKRASRRDIRIAALNAVRLLRPDVSTQAGTALYDDAVNLLTRYLDRSTDFGQIRAHAFTALSRLTKDAGRSSRRLVARCTRALDNRKTSVWIHQSATLALGEMASPEDTGACQVLERYLHKGKNEQARFFAAIALGRIGGASNRDTLLRRFTRRTTPTLSRPWLALGLAILDHERREADKTRSVDTTAAAAIKQEFDQTRNPDLASAYAVAMGIMGHRDAGDALVRRMFQYKNQDDACGYMALALGLMRYRSATRDIQAIVDRSARRERALLQSSIALGLLGDKSIATRLTKQLETRSGVAVLSAVSKALGFIGDRRTVDPLLRMLANKKAQDLGRAFAAVAIGLVGDKEPLPWNSKIAIDLNYRANAETLTTWAGTGVLDIL